MKGLAWRKPEWVLLLFKILRTTNDVVDDVVKYTVGTAYDEPVFYCFGRNGRGEEGYITRQVQCRGGAVVFALSLLIFLVLLYSLLS